MLAGDFNAEDSETCLSKFLFEIKAKNKVYNYTRYKSMKILVVLILLQKQPPEVFNEKRCS